ALIWILFVGAWLLTFPFARPGMKGALFFTHGSAIALGMLVFLAARHSSGWGIFWAILAPFFVVSIVLLRLFYRTMAGSYRGWKSAVLFLIGGEAIVLVVLIL